MPRPDFSEYVAHFTKDTDPFGKRENATDDALKAIGGSSLSRLLSILKMKTILATPMPWTNKRAVAFTECPWGALLAHAKQYSSHAVGFKKSYLFEAGGGPAIYLRPDLHENQKQFGHVKNPTWKGFDPALYAFVTPFCPKYAPEPYKKQYWSNKRSVDYSHEREWRVPSDFSFELSQVQFVIVPDYDTVAQLPKPLKDAIGREKFIMLDVYSQIEKLWPVHLL